MNIRLTGIAVMLSMLLCASTVSAFEYGEDSRVSTSWGTSVQAAKKAQIANPDAGTVTGPVEGLDGIAAENTMDVYHDSFTAKAARKGFSIDSISVIAPGGGQY